jgi:predicted nucleotidyltransferase
MIDLTQNKDKIIENIKSFVNAELFREFPFLKNSSAITISGSIASNTYDKDSDIDLHIIRSENMEKTQLQALKNYKQELSESGSNIELRFARTYEVLEEYLNWNDDYILGEFQNAIFIHDSNNRLNTLLDKFRWYPDDVFKDKIKYLLSELLLITEKEIEKTIQRENKYYFYVLKTKFLRFSLTTIRLLNKKYPVYDKKLFETTQELIKSDELKNLLLTILDANEKEQIKAAMLKVRDLILNEVRNKTDITDLNIEDLLLFSTKNKILFE